MATPGRNKPDRRKKTSTQQKHESTNTTLVLRINRFLLDAPSRCYNHAAAIVNVMRAGIAIDITRCCVLRCHRLREGNSLSTSIQPPHTQNKIVIAYLSSETHQLTNPGKLKRTSQQHCQSDKYHSSTRLLQVLPAGEQHLSA